MKGKIIATIAVFVVLTAVMILLIPYEKERKQREEFEAKYSFLIDKAKTDEKSAYILENVELYPDDILKLYNNHWEYYLDFAYNYPAHKDDYKTMKYTEEELNGESVPKLYMHDSRWAYEKIGDTYIMENGCVALCITMAYMHLTGKSDIDPVIVSQIAEDMDALGYWGNGISDERVKDVCEAVGLKTTEKKYYTDIQTGKTEKVDIEDLKAIIDNGHIAIGGMAGETFGYHAIIIHDYNEDGFIINDPGSEELTEKVWPFEEIEPEMYYLYDISV